MTQKRWIVLTALATLAAAILIFLFSAQQGEDSAHLSGSLTEWLLLRFRPDFPRLSAQAQAALLQTWEHIVRKLGHFCEYALFGACLMSLGYALHRERAFRLPMLRLWLLALLYAGSDELHQMFVEDRGPALADVAIDGSGALAGILFMAALLLMRLRWRAAKHSQDDRPL